MAETAAEKPLLKRCRKCEHAAQCRPTRKRPSLNTIEKWDWDRGACKTPTGAWTEPDGHDEFGCPSWQLIMGLV